MTLTAPSRIASRLAAALALLALALLALASIADAARRPSKPKIVFIRCSSVPIPCVGSHSIMVRTGRMLVGAAGMSRQAKVEFPVRTKSGRTGRRSVGGTFRTPTRLLVRVPGDAVSGTIRVVMPGGTVSNGVRIAVRRPPAKPKPPRVGSGGPIASRSVFDGNGMWIWYLSRSEGGDPQQIAQQAQAHGVRTVFVKSADGTNVWSQFSRTAVAALQATGLRVCGWQFVYGTDPIGEARAGAAAEQAGADCFVIDAEGAYEGKYAQAQRYVNALRDAVGDDYPIGLTSFPYVHYHPGFPYSVFMGPRGATFNLPQVYWKTIGDTVDESLQITYEYNAVYQTPIFPLGQSYDGTRAADLRRFRQLAGAYGARGVSWWVWQYASATDWDAIGAALDPVPTRLAAGFPALRAGAGGKVGNRGDLVVWAQQHLQGAGFEVAIDGDFGAGTGRVVRAYQASKGLEQTGAIDDATWPVLLRETSVTPDWVGRAAHAARMRAGAAAHRARAASVPRRAAANGPRSASLPAVRDEIPPGPGR
jgi:hypothetical protein